MEKRVEFKEDLCKGCGLCVNFCPKNIIFFSDHLNTKGYRPATVVDQEACISCGACAQVCPDLVITVFRPERKKNVS